MSINTLVRTFLVSMAIAAAATGRAAVVDISINNFAFGTGNATVKVNVGDTVRWTNNDVEDHTVTSGDNRTADGKFDSGNLSAGGGTYSVLFDRVGTFPYFCQYHGSMVSAIQVVQPPKTWEVGITGFAFHPNALTIVAGDTVNWTQNDTGTTHSATSGTSPTADGTFDTGLLAAGASQAIQITQTGTIPYFCKRHVHMTATLTVLAAPLLGDANGDGTVDASDAAAMMQTAAGLTSAPSDGVSSMDVFPVGFGDGSVDMRDVLHLLRYVLKMDTTL